MDADFDEVEGLQPRVVTYTIAEAETLQQAMADLWCWAEGFHAARPNVTICGRESVNRQIQELQDRLCRARGDKPKELPF